MPGSASIRAISVLLTTLNTGRSTPGVPVGSDAALNFSWLGISHRPTASTETVLASSQKAPTSARTLEKVSNETLLLSSTRVSGWSSAPERGDTVLAVVTSGHAGAAEQQR